ncbi:Hypothetical protein EUBREC_2995 [Agathobacter rectalis ATCC 33656]|uniref:Uncharacterized protein n=1 Tax=Agathobacter rectalis (strain ATCC 33656 / DSM 3377 / JCM 17463 / KCTC 5835 / VPI 0990) TaxID=515619 RepID=C4ZI86_AGARV|nr:Hypothetical protein EUBREC_2995 [Agathobacter rectalis ATCC 33656]
MTIIIYTKWLPGLWLPFIYFHRPRYYTCVTGCCQVFFTLIFGFFFKLFL